MAYLVLVAHLVILDPLYVRFLSGYFQLSFFLSLSTHRVSLAHLALMAKMEMMVHRYEMRISIIFKYV